jgi:hypothetical protein
MKAPPTQAPLFALAPAFLVHVLADFPEEGAWLTSNMPVEDRAASTQGEWLGLLAAETFAHC